MTLFSQDFVTVARDGKDRFMAAETSVPGLGSIRRKGPDAFANAVSKAVFKRKPKIHTVVFCAAEGTTDFPCREVHRAPA